MSAADDSPQPTAHEPEPGCSLNRRGFLQASAGAAAGLAMASASSGIVSAGHDGDWYRAHAHGGVSPIAIGSSGVDWMAGTASSIVSGIFGDDEWQSKYEYEKRVDIYREAYNWHLFEKRAVADMRDLVNTYSKVAMEDGLVDLYDSAVAGVSSSEAITSAQNVVKEEFSKLASRIYDHYEQMRFPLETWFSALESLKNDGTSDVSNPVAYTLEPFDPFAGEAYNSAQWAATENEVILPNGESRMVEFFADNGLSTTDEETWVSLIPPCDMSDLSREVDVHSKWNLVWQEIQTRYDNGFVYPDGSDPANELRVVNTSSDSNDRPSHQVTAIRVSPPDPADFDVNADEVEDVSDHDPVLASSVHRWAELFFNVEEEIANAINGIETFANTNYSDMLNNTDQWDREQMMGPSALRDQANSAETVADAALSLYGMGFNVNLENDVILEFPDSDAVDQAKGYLGVSSSEVGSLPVGEKIDPSSYDGGIYFAHEIGALGGSIPTSGDYSATIEVVDGSSTAISGVDVTIAEQTVTTDSSGLAAFTDLPGRVQNVTIDDGATVTIDTVEISTATGTVTLEHTGEENPKPEANATYSELAEPFVIVETDNGNDSVQFESRDLSEPDYDWQKVLDILEENSQASQDATEETVTVNVESGVGLPPLGEMLSGNGLLGIGIISVVILAIIGIVTDAIPGLGN